MMWRQCFTQSGRFPAWGTLVAIVLIAASPASAIDLTFLGWSDQHVSDDKSADFYDTSIDAMNGMAGRTLPTDIGGAVGAPAFIIGGGDITEWPAWAAKERSNDIITNQLIYPTYDVLGNHDFGGAVPSTTMTTWFIDRYAPPGAGGGELSYSFDYDGVHFVMLDSAFDPAGGSSQPLTQQALDWLRADLDTLSKTAPTVVVTHLCFDAMTNRDEFIGALGDNNILMILGGHYHQPALTPYGGQTFVQLPSPLRNAVDYAGVSVFHITDDQLTAAVWDADAEEWVTQFNLIQTIVTPEPTTLGLLALGGMGLLRRKRKTIRHQG